MRWPEASVPRAELLPACLVADTGWSGGLGTERCGDGVVPAPGTEEGRAHRARVWSGEAAVNTPALHAPAFWCVASLCDTQTPEFGDEYRPTGLRDGSSYSPPSLLISVFNFD